MSKLLRVFVIRQIAFAADSSPPDLEGERGEFSDSGKWQRDNQPDLELQRDGTRECGAELEFIKLERGFEWQFQWNIHGSQRQCNEGILPIGPLILARHHGERPRKREPEHSKSLCFQYGNNLGRMEESAELGNGKRL